MHLDFSNERILAVVAHPDDAELLCAGTLARAKADNATIGVCICCKGDKGQPKPPIEDIVEVRRTEAQEACALLDASYYELGQPDAGLADSLQTRKKLVEIFRIFRPTLIFVHHPEDYHSDHRAASQISEAASWFCASRGHRTKHKALDAPPKIWLMDIVGMGSFQPGFYIDISDFVNVKKNMLLCHRSQLLRKDDRDFCPLAEVLDIQTRARGLQSGVHAAEAFALYTSFKRTQAW